MNQFVFNCNNKNSLYGLCDGLTLVYNTPNPVILCVGSDLVIGDSLGPIVGSEIYKKLKGKAYVYGTLDNPITAKEINLVSGLVKKLHPKSKILVIDAAVGDKDDVGLIKLTDDGIKPGLGVLKNLNKIGDVSIIGITSERVSSSNDLLGGVRFSLIRKIVDVIVNSILLSYK